MKKKIKLTFIFDRDNAWIFKYYNRFSSHLNKKYAYDHSWNYESVKDRDIVFILGYTKIISLKHLRNNKLNLVVHESSLPKGKGFSPIIWQVLEGKNAIPIQLIEASEKVDSGDVYLKDKIILDKSDLYDDIREKQGLATFKLIKKFLSLYPKNIKAKQQKGSETFYRKRLPTDNKINISSTFKEEFNKLRVSNNEEWPAYFTYKGCTYILKIMKK